MILNVKENGTFHITRINTITHGGEAEEAAVQSQDAEDLKK